MVGRCCSGAASTEDRLAAAQPYRVVESLLGLRTLLTGHEPKTARTAAFRLLSRTLWSLALKRPKGA